MARHRLFEFVRFLNGLGAAALLAASTRGFAAEPPPEASAEKQIELSEQKSKKAQLRDEARTLAADCASTTRRREFADSLKIALEQTQEQKRKLQLEAKEILIASRRKM